MVRCGRIRVRREFDPRLIQVVSCARPTPSDPDPQDTVEVTATVENPNTSRGASFAVNFAAMDLPNEPVITRVNGRIGPADSRNSPATTQVTATFVPAFADRLPDPPFNITVDANVVPGSVGGLFAPADAGEPLEADAPERSGSRAMADGGIVMEECVGCGHSTGRRLPFSTAIARW